MINNVEGQFVDLAAEALKVKQLLDILESNYTLYNEKLIEQFLLLAL